MKISDLDFFLTLAHAIASDFFQHLLREINLNTSLHTQADTKL